MPPPSDEEVTAVLARVLRQTKKDWAELDAAWAGDEYEELQQRAIQERLVLADAQRPRPRARRLAVLEGFSLHADTAAHGQARPQGRFRHGHHRHGAGRHGGVHHPDGHGLPRDLLPALRRTRNPGSAGLTIALTGVVVAVFGI